MKELEDALNAAKEKMKEVDKMPVELDMLQLEEAARAERERALCKQLEDLRVTAEKEKNEALEEVAEENERGFDRALAQVRVLYPDMDISKTGFFKDIVDGRLVDA